LLLADGMASNCAQMCLTFLVVARQKGSPADESKRVFVGDKLLQVQGRDVSSMSALAIEEAICGAYHSQVNLLFLSAFDGELLAIAGLALFLSDLACTQSCST